jgi:hypothetical protein
MSIGAGVVQSVCPTTDWTTDDQSSVEAKDYSSSLCVQTSSEPPVQCVPGGRFPGRKTRPVCDASHLPLSRAEVKNDYELYVL